MKSFQKLLLSPYGYILLHLILNLLIFSILQDYFRGDKAYFDDQSFWESGVHWLNQGGLAGVFLAFISIFLIFRKSQWWEIVLVNIFLIFPLLLFSIFCWYSYALLFGLI